MSDAPTLTNVATATTEKLTAWQRWELPAFEAGSSLARNVGLPTAAEVEQMQRQAREEASQLGYAEGQQRGYAEGMKKALEERQRLADLIKLLETQVDEKVAQALMDLSLDIAQQVIQQSLKVHPELLIESVRAAIASLPVFNQSAHVILNPTDAVLVRENIGEQLAHSGWKILEDSRMERGGSRVETANSQVDATLEARWNRVVAAMGQEHVWMVQK